MSGAKRKLFAIVTFAMAAAAVGGYQVAARATTPQDAAKQVPGQPASYYWAVIVGISKYDGKTPQLPGAANDARNLANYLKSIGWWSDHIYLVTDGGATRDNILKGLRWLASKTDSKSAAIFHFSGHEMPFKVNGRQHVSMRSRENKFLMDSDFGKELSRIRAVRMWVDMSLCRAGGFDDAGTISNGRVLTYAAPEKELAYEDSGIKQSIFSYFEIQQGMAAKKADRNGDGQVTVEEAFWWARQPVWNRTSNKQHPTIVDKLSGDFIVKPPAAKSTTPKPSSTSTPTASPTPTDTPTPTASPTPTPTPSPTPTESDTPTPTPSATPSATPSGSSSPTPSSGPTSCLTVIC